MFRTDKSCCPSCKYWRGRRCERRKTVFSLLMRAKCEEYEEQQDLVISAVLGAAIGDALGVPVEFYSAERMKRDPVRGMRAHGTHDQPSGTWSDDTSIILATMDAMLKDPYDPSNVAEAFLDWMQNGKYTPYGDVFDIGNTTKNAIMRFANGEEAVRSGGITKFSNGNGSLMRILPAAFYLYKEDDFEARKRFVYDLSSITHGHPISEAGCHFYVEFTIRLIRMRMEGVMMCKEILYQAYSDTADELNAFYKENEEVSEAYARIFTKELPKLSREQIRGNGYVVATLEAVFWTLLRTETFTDAILSVVNLGDDTDTTGCIAGGIAGLVYGSDEIPKEWKKVLEKRTEICVLSYQFSRKIGMRK